MTTQEPHGTPSLAHIPALDGVRGVAVLAVMLYHFDGGRLLPGGFLGVDIFFVLSGFLITLILLREHARSDRLDLKKFYLKRLLRLVPALVVLLFFVAGIELWSGLTFGTTSLSVALGSSALYVSGWVLGLTKYKLGLLHHTWSLSVEEFFYLVWPVTLWFLLARIRRNTKWGKRLLLIAVGLCIVAVAYHRCDLWEMGRRRVYFTPDVRLDSMLVGCFAAFVSEFYGVRRSKVLAFLASAAGAVVAYMLWASQRWTGQFVYQEGFTLFAVCAGVLVLYAGLSAGWFSRALSSRPLVHAGKISYGLYLWHLVVYKVYFEYANEPRGEMSLWTLVFVVAISWAVTLASYRLVEQPFLRLKARL